MHLVVPPKTVLETILDWSKGRPMWQRDALRRIVSIGAPDALAINDILAICKKEHGEADISLTAMPLEAAHLPANPGNGASINLVSLGDFVGVNQLAQNQTLVFEQRGLTVVYGPNGAGKSGYGRVLKRACRARKAAEIMPNAYSQTAGVKAAARFTITRDGVQQPALTWQDDASPDPVLSAISVFDRECGAVHIQDKTEVAFRPFGLDIPDELATVCAMVKELLQAEETRLKALRDPVLDKPTWRATTEVGRLMSSLKHNSDLKPLSALANMTSEERARLQQLAEGLAKNPVEAAAEQLQFASGIARVRQYLKKVEQDYSDEVLGTLKSLAEDARTKRSAATIAAQGAFKDAALPSVGANVWRELWEAARHYSKHIEQQFPADEGEHCLLCHQPLTAEAGVRLGNFESFVRDGTERQAEEARNFFVETLSAFNSHQPDIRLVADVRRRIAVQRADVAARMLRFMAIADLRRRQCLRDIEHDGDITLHPMSEMPEADLLAIEGDLRAYASQLEAAADVEGRRLLQAEHDELQDRSSATALYQVAMKEVERLAKLERIGRCLAQTVTTPITKLGNELADDVITPRMRDRFQEEIVRLAAEKVRVEVVRSGGQYGSPSYQIRLFANARSKVHLVLSEGEQTCVALAAFLTELATATHKSALVFDDPVTSLDHRWRRKVAQRLVDEGKERQIIVFTHDLVFLNDLNDTAQDRGVPVKLANLSRGPDGTGVVADGLPWDHGSVRARLDKLEKDQRAAKALYDCGDEVNYHASARHLYGFLRATWERAVEEIVFAVVLMRHRDYIDTKTLKRVTALQEADTETFRSAYQKCNEIIDAHDPSRARNEEPPPPSEMADDIKALKDWADALRTRQNAVK